MSKRIISLAVVFCILLSGVVGRCGYIIFTDTYKVDSSYNSITLDISNLYTNIYSRNMTPLNNNSKSLVAIVKPNEKALSELKLVFNEDKIKSITEELKKGYPVILTADKYANTKYIKLVEVINENSDDMLCRHLINKNYGGLEKYTDRKIGSLSINYSVNVLGKVLDGDEGTLIDKNYDSKKGIKISIDEKIQKIVEASTDRINKGSVVVLDCNTSQILACVSIGNDYLNRSFSPYAVGSVFKLVVAISALENNTNPSFTCKSKITVGDTTFHCQNNHKHGKEKIKEALANSCNCYFVNLALKLGRKNIYNTALKLGFNSSYSLYDKTFTIPASSFPSLLELKSKGQLALLGFGQGKLTDTPAHFASVVCAIANGGYYNYPTLNLKKSNDVRVFSYNTAKTLQSYMKNVVDFGTGVNAQYKSKTAGKTATAQSGVYVDGKEQLNTWFVGFYPYEKPRYTIAVMCEGGKSGSEDCCPIFRTIVEKLDKL